MKINQLKKELDKLANPKQAKLLQGFFKTGKGQYGEGDIFLGIKVPIQRQVAKKYNNLAFNEIQTLLNSQIHDHRMIALFILVSQYQYSKKQKNKKIQKQIYNFYLKNFKNINNWDLVDLSSHKIVGDYLLDKPRDILYKFARSNHLWTKRISVIATFAFINNHDFKDSLKIAKILLNDDHDLIHKAIGWMLREVGKRDQKTEEQFLKKYYKKMPRTMLRYSIERFSEPKRKFYMKK